MKILDNASLAIKLILAVVTLVVIAVAGYLFIKQVPATENAEQTISLGNHQNQAVTVEGWSTWKMPEIGIGVQYPPDWKQPSLTENNEIVGEASEKYWASWSTSGPSPWDSDGIFSFSYSRSHASDNISNRYVEKNLGLDSKLVITYTNLECSPGLEMRVTMLPLVAVTGSDYSFGRVDVYINYDFSKDEMLVAQSNTVADSCDLSEFYRQIATKIEAGTYSEKLSEYINTAQKIVESTDPL